jgi:hypothetical protein
MSLARHTRRGGVLSALLAAGACSATAVAACGDDAGTAATSSSGAGGAGATTTTSGPSSVAQVTSGAGGLPESFEVQGIVVDQDGAPVSDATFLQAGGTPAGTTGDDGLFTLTISQSIVGEPAAVAAKVGYRSGGYTFEDGVPTQAITLTLHEVKAPDNALDYTFGHPGVGDPAEDVSTAYCGHCHTTFAAQFQTSAHAKATRDPLVQDLYAGVASAAATSADCALLGGVWRAGTVPGQPTTSAPRCYVGAGVLPDLNTCGGPAELACDDPALPQAQRPQAFGACADCHALAMDGPAGGRDLLEATGLAYEFGNHCDACHHIRDVDLSAPPGLGGRLVMQRPRERVGDLPNSPLRQVMFGPYPDVPIGFMGGSWQPKFSTSELCAGCHEQKQGALLPGSSLDGARWPQGLPTHGTFTEWTDGPYNQPGTQCQACHMPAIDDMFNSVDVSNATNASTSFGFGRSPDQLRSHAFKGPLSKVPGVPRLIDGAVSIDVATAVGPGVLDVDVTLVNVACGHAIPTGEPMRSLVLSVDVSGCSQRFVATSGMTVPDVGGARAEGVVGADVAVAGAALDWPAGAAIGKPGDVVRFVRPTGAFDDYDGVGLFEGATLTSSEKGMEIADPIGAATIVSVVGTVVTLDASVPAAAGDLAYLGDADPASFTDGDPARALAGSPGWAFSKVLVDPDGDRGVPHFRAVDIVSDNRIRPLASATTQHRFAIPPGCTAADVRATVLYRPLPVTLAGERAWDARDFVVATKTVPTPL